MIAIVYVKSIGLTNWNSILTSCPVNCPINILFDGLIIGSWQFFIHFELDNKYVVGKIIVIVVAPGVARVKVIVNVVGSLKYGLLEVYVRLLGLILFIC